MLELIGGILITWLIVRYIKNHPDGMGGSILTH